MVMLGRFYKRWMLFASVFLAMALDAAVTLLGQPDSYWNHAGGATEGAPHAKVALDYSPLAFVGLVLVIFIGVSVLIFVLPRMLGLLVSVSVSIGSYVGALTWFIFAFNFSYWFLYLYCPLISIPIILSCRQCFCQVGKGVSCEAEGHPI